MKLIPSLMVLVTLAACGADGLPQAPASNDAAQTGVTVSGCVTAGVVTGAPVAPGGPVRC